MTAPSQDTDVVDILTTDHHDVLDLIATIKTSTDPAERRATADTVIAEIVRHSVAEEMYVYPAMRKHLPDGAADVEHDISEHKEIERAMKALEGLDASTEEFTAQVAQLEELLHHHASSEETTQFPALRAHLSAEDLVSLGERVLVAKQIAPTRPHPASPNAELFHKVFGPGVGLVDKLRDAVTGRAHNT